MRAVDSRLRESLHAYACGAVSWCAPSGLVACMSEQAAPSAIRRSRLSVCAALLICACSLAFNPLPFESPVSRPAAVPAWATDATAVRQPSLAPRYRAGVFTYGCNDCHKILPAGAGDTVRTVIQHREIVLEHGINTWCLSCHHPVNRNAFVDDRGGEIPWNQPQRLCAKCHGPVYRDWQHGSHGRTNGYWDTTRGEQTRRRCIECHDPHRPPFPSMRPAPGPNTLRMGRQHGRDRHEAHHPLRIGGPGGGAGPHGTGLGEE